MLFGLFIGVAIGFFGGTWLATTLLDKAHKELIADYKKSVDYWFNEYMKELKSGHELTTKMLEILKR